MKHEITVPRGCTEAVEYRLTSSEQELDLLKTISQALLKGKEGRERLTSVPRLRCRYELADQGDCQMPGWLEELELV